MTTPLYLVDAFAERPFGGNPAGVCLLPDGDDHVDETWMKHVAREVNAAETAFLRRGKDRGVWHLRWFTPTVEVDLCGHATLASAHTLWESGREGVDRLDFDTKSGRLSARRIGGEGDGGEIELDFPAEPATAAGLPPDVIPALGVPEKAVRWTGRNRLDYLVEVASEADLRAVSPDFRRLGAACAPARGCIVTARSARPEYDFASRYFAPAAGIDEDPVTGSTHCGLAPYWMERLGKNPLRGFQASARGGAVGVRVDGGRVALSGRAVTVLRGELV
jgi:PhzF family phenazine biosynthesis protein